MKNILLEIEYDGSNFSGYQIQPDVRTVEGELKRALEQAVGEKVELISAGRTDKKVHSLGQIVNFKTTSTIPGYKYMELMDFLLPDDISIKDSREVALNFHARFDAKARQYRYVLYNRRLVNALYRNYAYHFPYDLDLELMQEAAKDFLGSHDFTSFKSNKDKNSLVNPLRTIEDFRIYREGDFFYFIVKGNAFLHNMVRIMVGSLIYIGSGKMQPDAIGKILALKDRRAAGITAGAEGLYLEKVFYK